jgi:hypothetical protein
MIAATARRPTTIDELIPSDLAARLDRLDVVSRRMFAGRMQGERRSKRRGQSVEFADYRTYVAGDDLRRIDWNVFARLDRFFVRIFQEEEDLALHVVLDASASMDAGGDTAETGNKLLFAQRLAMALGYIGLVNNNRVAAWVFDQRWLRAMEPRRGRPNVQRLGRFLLDALSPRPGAEADGVRGPAGAIRIADFTAAMRAIAMSRTGKGVVVLLSDFLIPEGYREGLRFLASPGGAGGGGSWSGAAFDTYCLQVLSPGELDPSEEGAATEGRGGLLGDLRLTDAETGRTADVTITADLLRRYRESVQRYIADLGAFCAARGMHHLLVRSDSDLPTLLLDVLRRRGMLR